MGKRKRHKRRNGIAQGMIERSQSAGPHQNRTKDVDRGSSRKPKHKKALGDPGASSVEDKPE